MISVLVTGKDSQLAMCIKDLQEKHPLLDLTFKNSKELDITSEASISKAFEDKPYDYCVNCAAYTAVDKAESEQEKAIAVNTIGAKNLAVACKENNTVLIHISTDFVFDGKQNIPYTEEDETNPINVYGKTKRDGEREISNTIRTYFIIRTSWLYSNYGNNFVKTILRLSNKKEEINVVNDQIGSPTYALDLANFILNIISRESKKYGVYHYSNNGEISWYDFAVEIVNLFKLDVKVNPIKISNYISLASRPNYSVLDIYKTKRTFHIKPKNWDVILATFLRNYNNSSKY